MNKNFDVEGILEAVDLLVSDNKYSQHVKNNIRSNYKRYTNKNLKMKEDKFEIDNIELVKSDEKKSDTPVDDSVNQKKEDKFEIDSIELVKPDEKKSDTPVDDSVTEKIILDAEVSLNNLKDENKLSEKNHEKVLVLEDELVVDDTIEENNSNEETYIEEGNNLEELENNYIYLNENLKSKNIKQDEKIKDLNILVDKFSSKERYADLDKNLKLYQEDNAALRQKILQLSNKETALRLQLADLKLTEKIVKDNSQKFEQSVVVNNENIKKLNEEISILKQEDKQLKEELSKLKKEKDSHSKNIEEKIKFYREENAKIIIDKNNIDTKLENTKNQLSVNEATKHELKMALDNLNQIISSSNIETGTFANRIEEPKQSVKNEKEEKIHKQPVGKLDESSLDYLVKEIFSK